MCVRVIEMAAAGTKYLCCSYYMHGSLSVRGRVKATWWSAASLALVAHEQQRERTSREFDAEMHMQRGQRGACITVERTELQNAIEQRQIERLNIDE